MFDHRTARQVSREYGNSLHRLWEDQAGNLLLGCKSRRAPGVIITWTALQEFKKAGGKYVGLRNPLFNVVVEVETLEKLTPKFGNDYVVVWPDDVGIEVACEFGNDEVPF